MPGRRLRRSLVALCVGVLVLPAVVHARVEQPPRTRIFVMFERSAELRDIASLHAAAGAVVSRSLDEIYLHEVRATPEAIRAYRSSPIVRTVEAPRRYEVMGRRVPNDPLVRLQWGLRRVNAFDAWRIENGKKSGVTVGVIDTGVDDSHVDLQGRLEIGFDFYESDDDPYDDHGHGTHVSGIIAAATSNRKGIAGLAPGASVIPMKACEGRGSCDGFSIFAGAIDATRRGADVLNLSLGGAGQCSEVEQTVFDWVHDQGTLVVVSAGNSARSGNPVTTPASCDRTLAVSAIDRSGRKATFSTFGNFVDIAAPGVDIWSTLPPLVSIASEHAGYGSWQGTSMAAPFVAAAAALVRVKHPEWSPDQIQDRLLSTAVDAGPKGRDDRFGAGILDVLAALK